MLFSPTCAMYVMIEIDQTMDKRERYLDVLKQNFIFASWTKQQYFERFDHDSMDNFPLHFPPDLRGRRTTPLFQTAYWFST